MRITVNGLQREVGCGCAIADLLPRPDGHAVAVNGIVVPRADHARALADGDVVEIVSAVQGG